ncbi:MAG: ATP-binding protein [Carboxydocellales bacterium]
MLLLIATLTFYLIGQHYLKEQFNERLLDLAQTAALMVDINKHQEIRTVEDEQKTEYKELKAILKNLNKTHPEVRFIYTLTQIEKTNKLKFVLDAEEDQKMIHHPGEIYDISRVQQMQEAFDRAITDKHITQDELGYFLSGYAPIKNSTGKSVALIWIGISADSMIKEENKLKIAALVIIGLGALLAWHLCRIIAGDFCNPIQRLIIGTQRVAENDFNYKVELKNEDEFGELTKSFNYMVRKIEEYEKKTAKEMLVEKKQKKQIFKVYKDVMFAVSHGKFILIDEEERIQYVEKGTVFAEQSINKPEDVGACRRMAEKVLTMYSIEAKEIRQTLLAISEAVTNVVKHAEYGKLTIRLCGGLLKLVVTDCGPGLPFDKIPYMVFFSGFSTKTSMGFGFSLMYQYSDKLVLHTSNSGTTVVMEKKIA